MRCSVLTLGTSGLEVTGFVRSCWNRGTVDSCCLTHRESRIVDLKSSLPPLFDRSLVMSLGSLIKHVWALCNNKVSRITAMYLMAFDRLTDNFRFDRAMRGVTVSYRVGSTGCLLTSAGFWNMHSSTDQPHDTMLMSVM